MDSIEEKDKWRKKFVQTGRGRRQDHATHGNGRRWMEWDDIGDKVRLAARRMYRQRDDSEEE